MDNEEDTISLEVSPEGEVFLFLDRTALAKLILDLTRLQKSDDHFHYMTDDWGGTELTSQVFDKKHSSVHHLKVIKVAKG